MASSPSPHPSRQNPDGSPYCSDPNCQSCKDLRVVQEAIRMNRPLPPREKQIYCRIATCLPSAVSRVFAQHSTLRQNRGPTGLAARLVVSLPTPPPFSCSWHEMSQYSQAASRGTYPSARGFVAQWLLRGCYAA